MKFPFFKSLLVAGALLLAWNCTDSTMPLVSDYVAISEEARVLSTQDGVLFIMSDGTVLDGEGKTVGHLEGNTIIGLDDQVVIEDIPVDELETVKIMKTSDGKPLTVSDDGQVTDAEGNEVGTIDENGSVIGNDGEVIIDNSNHGNENQQNNPNSASNTNPGTSSGNNVANSSNSNGTNSANSNGSNNQNNNTPTSVSSVTDGNITYTDNLTQSVAKGSAITPIVISGMQAEPSRQSWNAWFLNNGSSGYENGKLTISGDVPEYPCGGSSTCELEETWIIDGKAFTIKINITEGSGNNNNNNQNQDPKPNPGTSSSSKQQQTPSSSSKQQQTQSSASQQTTGCPNIVAKGNASGSGWATRYWDGCKPHCSWSEHAHGNFSRQCSQSSKGKEVDNNYGNGSVCDGGGSAMTCVSQIPFTVNGCSNIGFAFAAVPASNGGACGKCFELSFTGTGKYETKDNHVALAGKKLIVMVTNVGYDVQQGQFDIMIPGGGPGLFNKTNLYGWGSQGETYGGLLSNCEKEVGWDGDLLTKRKNCLLQKCESAFGGDSQAIQGCKFLANFMEAAGNPNHNYREVECPQVLKDKY